MCNGQAAECPEDRLAGGDQLCRAAEGVCDAPEACDGNDADCPDDQKLFGVSCRSSQSYCDAAETCSGLSADCPEDSPTPAHVGCEELDAYPQLAPPERLPIDETGGLAYESGVTIELPAEANSEEIEFIEATLRSAPEVEVASTEGVPQLGTDIGVAVEFHPAGAHFAQPIVVTVPLTQSLTPGAQVAMLQYDDSAARFDVARLSDGSPITGIVGDSGDSLFFAVDHFSTYTGRIPFVITARFNVDRITSVGGHTFTAAVPSYLFHNGITSDLALRVDPWRLQLYEDVLYELFRAKDQPRPPFVAELAQQIYDIGDRVDLISNASDVQHWAETAEYSAFWLSDKYPEFGQGVLLRVQAPLDEARLVATDIAESGSISGEAVSFFKCAVKGFLGYMISSGLDRALVEERMAAFEVRVANTPLVEDPMFVEALQLARSRVRADYAADQSAMLSTLEEGLRWQTIDCVGEAIWEIGREYVIKGLVTSAFGTATGFNPFLAAATKIVESYVENDVVAANRNASRLTLMATIYNHGGFVSLAPEGTRLELPEAIDLDDEAARELWTNRLTAFHLLSMITELLSTTVERADMSMLTRGMNWLAESVTALQGASLNQERAQQAALIALQTNVLNTTYEQIATRMGLRCGGDPVACQPLEQPIPAAACARIADELVPLTSTMEPLRDYACPYQQHDYQVHTVAGLNRYTIRAHSLKGALMLAASDDSALELPSCSAPEGCVVGESRGGTGYEVQVVIDGDTTAVFPFGVWSTEDCHYVLSVTVACEPRACQLGACGVVTDGCGGELDCGLCQEPDECSDGADNCSCSAETATPCTCALGYFGDGASCQPAKVVGIATGNYWSCALKQDGSVKCWGYNASGQLGLGDMAQRGDGPGEMGQQLPYVALGTGTRATALTAGFLHTCALLDDGSVKCWGLNSHGQLGYGDTENRGDQAHEMGDDLPTVALGAGRTALKIVAAAYHTCAILDDGSVKCWGGNQSGMLGLGDTANRGDQAGEMGDQLPSVQLGTGRRALALTAAGARTCALLDDGHVKCWGQNTFGDLGLGDTANRGDQPGEMGDALPALALGTGRSAVTLTSAGGSHCAVLDDDTTKCWGWNASGRLGLGLPQSGASVRIGDAAGEMGDSLPAVSLGTGRSAVALVGGIVYTCALLDDESVKCWGASDVGQLGLGDTTTRGDGAAEMGDDLPAVSLGFGAGRSVVMLSSYYQHACALADDGSVKCWGANDSGQLGLGNTSNRGDGPGEMGSALPALDL